ncbi:hypothetical protein ACA910_006435 [Epithemia clementina (nom. ined.)]
MNNDKGQQHSKRKLEELQADSKPQSNSKNNSVEKKKWNKERARPSAQNSSQKPAAVTKIVITDVVKPSALPPSYEVSRYDVVCGRGKSSYERPGNRRFLDIVNDNVAPYRSATQKKQKAAVLCNIVNEVRSGDGTGKNAGRFVKQMDDGSWWEIGDSVAREKAGQAMRVAVRMRAEHNHMMATNSMYSDKKLKFLDEYYSGVAAITNAPQDNQPLGGARPAQQQQQERSPAETTYAVPSAVTQQRQEQKDSFGIRLRVASSNTDINTEVRGATTTTDGSDGNNGNGALLRRTVVAPPPHAAVAPELSILNGAQTLSSLRAGAELPAVGRLWLVVQSNWQPGSNDNSGILWMGRTTKFILPSEQEPGGVVTTLGGSPNTQTVTVADPQRLVGVNQRFF